MKHLTNAEGLHEIWKTWERFLDQCDLKSSENGRKWYLSANCHYFVDELGNVTSGIYGYHGENFWEVFKGNK